VPLPRTASHQVHRPQPAEAALRPPRRSPRRHAARPRIQRR
jgi:hypothetical protein